MGRIAFSAVEVAEMLGISESQVRRLVANGTLPRVENLGECVRIGRSALITTYGADAIAAFESDGPTIPMRSELVPA